MMCHPWHSPEASGATGSLRDINVACSAAVPSGVVVQVARNGNEWVESAKVPYTPVPIGGFTPPATNSKQANPTNSKQVTLKLQSLTGISILYSFEIYIIFV